MNSPIPQQHYSLSAQSRQTQSMQVQQYRQHQPVQSSTYDKISYVCHDVPTLKAALLSCPLEHVRNLLHDSPITLGSAAYTMLISTCGEWRFRSLKASRKDSCGKRTSRKRVDGRLKVHSPFACSSHRTTWTTWQGTQSL
jgi:hypothetical protein